MILKVSKKKQLKFPVLPSSYKIGGGGTDFIDVNVVNGGERTIIGGKKLRTVSFSSFFPKNYDESYCCTDITLTPLESIQFIEDLRKTGKYVRLIIPPLDINMPVTIQSFDYEERGGEPGDIYFDINFKEFETIVIEKKVKTKKKNKKNDPPKSNKVRQDNKARQKTYTVIKGDTLCSIAKKLYGNSSKYTVIYEANKKIIKNPSMIQSGWKLVIP